MKKSIVILCMLLVSIHSTFAYELSSKDKASLEKAKTLLWQLSEKKDIVWFEERLKKIDKLLPQVKSNIRFWFIFQELKNELLLISELKKPKMEKNNSQFERDFFETYGKNIVYKNKLRDGCTKHFDFVDEIAQKNDFPTALILAVWSKEFNCILANPANGWGPFQITSQYHPPGEITLEEMGEKIQQYIDFSKGKINSYHSNQKLKQRFGEKNIELSYSYYTLRDLQLYSILYNGISSDTNIETNIFANGNLNETIITQSDGIITLFLKILKWKIEK